jgi:hypothetical protein
MASLAGQYTGLSTEIVDIIELSLWLCNKGHDFWQASLM